MFVVYSVRHAQKLYFIEFSSKPHAKIERRFILPEGYGELPSHSGDSGFILVSCRDMLKLAQLCLIFA